MRRAVLAFWRLRLVYVGALLWIDHDKGLLSGIARLLAVLAMLMLRSFATLLGLLCWLAREFAPAADNARPAS